ncbi:MAG: class I SAM-dependent methyltransferase [Anaerolineae bacterium]|nr:class I SAM-dependent methyltransferase [Anaerolineae bacterium]
MNKGVCPVCGTAESMPVIALRQYWYIRCCACRTVYVDPMPSAAEAAAYYQHPAYFAGDEEAGYRDYAAMHKALAPHFRRRLRVLARWFPQRGCLLDVGCADGYFLEMAWADGWKVAGVEISEPMAKETADRLGVPVVTSLDDLSETYDAVTLWEVVEHFPDPVGELQQLVGFLRPGGVLMLSTPNAGHWQALREPEAWNAYRPPAHLVLFTAGSLKFALEKAGFSSVRIWNVSPLPPLPGLVRRATAPLAHALADGSARPWRLALIVWRVIRLLGWAWQKAAHPRADIFTTLEALAWRPM